MDSKRIHDKEAKFEELTPGQITALLSNERSMERVNEDLEELEEAIQTSILEKLHPSVAKAQPLTPELNQRMHSAGESRSQEAYGAE